MEEVIKDHRNDNRTGRYMGMCWTEKGFDINRNFIKNKLKVAVGQVEQGFHKKTQ